MAVVEVLRRFIFTSAAMWMAPLVVLWAFQSDLIPSVTKLSPQASTLLSGVLAVISVNVVIALYIWMALRDPPSAEQPSPDPAFAAAARASIAATATEREDEQDTVSKKDD